MDIQLKQEDKFKYIEQGEGEVMLLLHGLFGALSNWKEVLDHFSKRYKVVIPIIPIFEMNLLKLSVDGLADFIYDFVEYKKFTKINLLGNSLGGHIGLVFIKKHSSLVNSLVLTGSSGLYESAFGSSYPKKGDKNYIRERVSLTFYDPKSATEELVEEVYSTLQDRTKVLRLLTMAKSAIRHNMRKDLPHFIQPTCLVWGLQDTITPPNVAEEFYQLLPNAELHFLDHCGHAAMMEKPNEFNMIVDDFFSKIFQK